MNKTEFLLAIDELLEVNPGTLKGSEKLDSFDNWDSLAVISLIALADEKLGVVVGSEAIAEAKPLTIWYAYSLSRPLNNVGIAAQSCGCKA